jgi:predicted metal-dependent hydrolase
VVVSRRARSWRLSIHPHTGLSVVLPAGSRLKVEELLDAHADWIHRSLIRAARRPVPRHAPLAESSALPYAGTVLRLKIDPDQDLPPQADWEQGILRVGALAPRRLVRDIEAWYRRQAEALFPERLRVVNARLGLRYGRVTIRDQRTRWGSCSARGNLAFNWRLMMAPLAIVDSVVAHELTHLIDPSHAPSFWRRLAAVDPDYHAHRTWLRRYGAWLAVGFEPPPPAP